MTAEAEVRARIDRFVSDLTTLIRSVTAEAFEEALQAQRAVIRSTGHTFRAPRARGRGADVGAAVVVRARRRKRDAGALGAAAEKRVKTTAKKRATPDQPNDGNATTAQLSLPLE